ncbi:MAG: cation:proton antiporter, partial [bacterium]|nr:cation:proton antiporter [Candidatus Colisoma equi]
SFSAKDMKKVRSVALPAAIVDTAVMIWLGHTVGVKFFGWTPVQSVFLGVAICDSATTLLAKVIDEMGWGRRQFTKYVLGTSVCEDIICVGAIAVATGFAQGNGMSAGALAASLWWLLVFFLTVLVFGFILVPRLLKSVGKRKDDEALLMTVLGTCFLVVYFADKFHFSAALGAFLVGLIGASSDVRAKLGQLVDPIKYNYSAIFFVSIGLMVDPMALWHCLPQILLVSAVVIVGKSLNTFIASLATGCDIKTSVQVGFSLAQIGEFAFMVAILYAGLVNDTENPMFQIAVGASLLTTLLNPVLIRISDPVGDFVVRGMPERFRRWLGNYQVWIEKIRSSADSPAYMLLRAAGIKLGVYAVLMLSVSVVCAMLEKFDYSRFSGLFERYDKPVFFCLANIFSMSLMPMVVFASRALGDEIAELLTGDGNARWRTASRQLIRFVVLVAVVALFFVEWTMLNLSVLPTDVTLQGFSFALILGAGVFGWRFFVKAGRRATQRFQEALTAEERREGLVRMTTVAMPEGTIQRLKLTSNSPAIG